MSIEIAVNAEIHFHQQEEASVYFETNQTGDAEKLGEIAVAVNYAIRMMSNLDVCKESLGLATLLRDRDLLSNRYGHGLGSLKLIKYPGFGGRKQFIIRFRLTDELCALDVRPIGFDAEATGVGYYAPMSVVALIRFLAMKRDLRVVEDPHLEYHSGMHHALCNAACYFVDRMIGVDDHPYWVKCCLEESEVSFFLSRLRMWDFADV